MGEIRDACGYDLLQAMNTGHGGTLSTIHAKSAQNALNRLSDLALSARPNLNHSFVVRRLRKLSTSFCTAEGQPGVLPWRVAHNAMEGLTEGALGFVARRLRDGARPSPEFFRRSAARKHAPARKVFHQRGTNDLAKAQREDRARHPNPFGQQVQRPGISWVSVHAGDGDTHMLVRQRRKPAATSRCSVRQVQPQRLDKHHVGKLLRNHLFGSGVWPANRKPGYWQAGWGSVIASHLKVSTVAVRPNHSSTSGQ